MKKYLFTMATAAMLFASCSSDDTVVDNGANEEGLVEIKLGAASRVGADVSESKGRAAVTVDEWDNTPVGVFAVSVGEDVWGANSNNPVTILLDNEKGTIADKTNNGISWEPNVTHFYPRISTLGYNFYGYYPLADNAGLNGSDITTGDIAFTGSEDIMWAQVSNTDKPTTGYNADSFKGDTPLTQPNLHFNHLTTLLKFVVKKGDDYDKTTCAINEFSVNIPATYNLLIATQDTKKTAGTIVWGEIGTTGVSAVDKNITMPFSFGDSDTEVAMGQIFVKPEEASYILNLNIGNSTSGLTESKELKLAEGKTFEAGKWYTVTMTVNGPQEITLTATLEGWIDSKENIEFGI